MIEIKRRKISRPLTEVEVKKHAKAGIEPFASYRQDSKAVNFGCLFGISYRRFSKISIEPKWPIERIEAFILEKHLEDSVDTMASRHLDVEPRLWKYYAVSNFIIEQFFKSYVGFRDRMTRNEDFGRLHGYTRSFHGGIRRVPLLAFSKNEHGDTRKDEDLKEMSNWVNITANSSIQTDETAKVMGSLIQWCQPSNTFYQYAKPFGTVHDSVDFYIHKDHVIEGCKQIQELFEQTDDWQLGVKLPIDMTIVDLSAEGSYYKHGVSLRDYAKTHVK